MKRFVCVMVLAVVMLLSVAPVAQATDYRPWKRAMDRAFEVYFDRYWMPVTAQHGIWTEYTVGLTAPEYSLSGNGWGSPACTMATLVTSLWYGVPNGEWGPPLRQQLRPFLRPGVPTSELPRPPIFDVYPDTVILP